MEPHWSRRRSRPPPDCPQFVRSDEPLRRVNADARADHAVRHQVGILTLCPTPDALWQRRVSLEAGRLKAFGS